MQGKKLVRDKVHEIYKFRPMHIADDGEYWQELLKKLDEEVGEFKENNSTEDLADIMEVIYAIAEFKGLSIQELDKVRRDKANKRGRFRRRIIFDEKFDDESQDDSMDFKEEA